MTVDLLAFVLIRWRNSMCSDIFLKNREVYAMGLEDYKPELSEEELDFLEGWIEDCGGDEDWSEIWDGYDM